MPNITPDIEATSATIAGRIRALTDHTAPTLHALRRKLSRELADRDGRHVVRIALRLAHFDESAHRFIGYALVFHHPNASQSLGPRSVEQLARGFDHWVDVDTFAGHTSGPTRRIGRITDEHIHRWAQSNDRWWRRTALVSTVALNRKSFGGTGDVPRTLEVCQLFVDDPDDMVVKALSWALRELVQHDPKSVRQFLAEHQEVLAARVVREVKNKLSTGLKNPHRTKATKTAGRSKQASKR
ncbi:MAG: DNA alkylation repair protein [Phycisphaerales bacterium]|nr:MAG: DNA alkylation repair protein [Phycisphaerales bacterium]